MTDEEKKKAAEEEARRLAAAGQPTAEQIEAQKKRAQELESQLVAQTERANRSEALLQSYIQNPGATASNNPSPSPDNPYSGSGIDAARLISEPDKVLNNVVETAVKRATDIMEKRYREAENMKAQSESVRQSFYKTNPDLVGFEKIVGLVEGEVRMKYPNTPYMQLLNEIATASRAEIVQLKSKFGGGGQQPLGLENGGGGTGGDPKPDNEPAAPTPEQDQMDFLKERNTQRLRKLG